MKRNRMLKLYFCLWFVFGHLSIIHYFIYLHLFVKKCELEIQIFYGKNWNNLWIGKSFVTLIQQQKVSFDSTFILWTLYFLEFKRLKMNAMLTFKMIKISEIWHIWGCYHKSARPPDTKLFDFLKALQKPKRHNENWAILPKWLPKQYGKSKLELQAATNNSNLLPCS